MNWDEGFQVRPLDLKFGMDDDWHRMISRLPHMIAIVILAILSVGCATLADVENVQDKATDPAGPIAGHHIVGQTFVSHFPRLEAVQVLPVVYEGSSLSADSVLTFHLRRGVGDKEADIATASVKIAELKHNVPYRFDFHPVGDSKDKPFYFFLEASQTNGDSRISVWSSKEDKYPFGSRYVDGQQVDGDLTFRTYYGYSTSAILSDLAGGAGRYAWTILPLLAIFLLPGYLLLSLRPRKADFDMAEITALSVGLSIAVGGVGLLFAKLLGVRLDTPIIRAVAILLAVADAGLLLRDLRSRKEWKWPSREKLLFAACLAIVLVISAGLRFLHVRDLVAPMWVDSVQHAEIAQLIVANGGLPDSYRPFADVEPFSYHFGFHALVAFFHWLTGTDIPRSMLVIGQALNALTPLSAYLLASRLTRSRLGGLVTATVVGLISVMPAYYVSWGRYTQLTGMVLLPIVIVLSLDALSSKRQTPPLRPLTIAAIAVGGLVIAHPRVTVFFLCFLVAYLIVEAFASRANWRHLSSRVVGISAVGISGILIILPWMWNILGSLVPRTWQGASLATPSDNPFPWAFITASNDRILIGAAVLGLALGLVKRDNGAMLIGIWTGLMVLSANLYLIGLPGSTMISNGALAIALFLPVSLLDGQLISTVAEHARFERWKLHLKMIAAVGLIAVGLYGAQGLLGIVNPATALFFKEDAQAMEWIAMNTPKDAKFLINSYSWQYGIYAGSDGGYWIPALTGRKASLPSLLYALGKPDYVTTEASSMAKVSSGALSDEDMRDFLRANKIDYVYIGYRGGVLKPSQFVDKPGYREVYKGEGVWIFRVEKD